MDKKSGSFVWDIEKERANYCKHGVTFAMASKAFGDPKRKIYIDSRHSEKEERFFCLGKVKGKILTVRFTFRKGKIRIFGAGYWRKGEIYYAKKAG